MDIICGDERHIAKARLHANVDNETDVVLAPYAITEEVNEDDDVSLGVPQHLGS